MRVVVNRSLEHVKQWHSRAAPKISVPAPGRCSTPASLAPAPPENSNRSALVTTEF